MSSITSITINLRLDRLLISSFTSIFDHKSSIDLTLIVIDYFDYYRLFAYFLCKCLSLLRRGSRQAGGLCNFFVLPITRHYAIQSASRRRVIFFMVIFNLLLKRPHHSFSLFTVPKGKNLHHALLIL